MRRQLRPQPDEEREHERHARQRQKKAASRALSGRIPEAELLLAQARRFADDTGEGFWQAELLRLDGELALAAGGSERRRAEGSFRSALGVARAQRVRSFELRAATSLAALLMGEGRREEARNLVREALTGFEEGFDTDDVREAARMLSEL